MSDCLETKDAEIGPLARFKYPPATLTPARRKSPAGFNGSKRQRSGKGTPKKTASPEAGLPDPGLVSAETCSKCEEADPEDGACPYQLAMGAPMECDCCDNCRKECHAAI